MVLCTVESEVIVMPSSSLRRKRHYKRPSLGKWVLAAWLGFALVLVMALILGEGYLVVAVIGAMALASTSVHAALGRGPRADNS